MNARMDLSSIIHLKKYLQFTVVDLREGRDHNKLRVVVAVATDKEKKYQWIAFDDDSSSYFLANQFRVLRR